MSEYTEWVADNKVEETKTFSAYPSIYSLGHKAITELLFDSVTVEEKIDGSQFSAAITNGELQCRSKCCILDLDAPEKLFIGAVETFKQLGRSGHLENGVVYRGESIQSPRHSTLHYSRVPKGNVVIYDISRFQDQNYISWEDKRIECERLGLEVVSKFFEGTLTQPADLQSFLDRESMLGGTQIEGYVIKNYFRFGYDKKPLMGKFVSEKFKEIHGKTWSKNNPGTNDILENLTGMFKTEARWEKAVFHLRDDGTLLNDVKDIGPLIQEVMADVRKECEEQIKDILFKWAWEKKVSRAITNGLPQWYKNRLLQNQFKETA